eukprot:CAMPEP_0113941484 /NCGR_PEP_ID=MMETSP1339-20121228/7377_1 /TAXON_ID=94617 /ORGANISM="Fibrocapsa japonica" /LENGTH=158 /DNA_ID=CAMNT_0000945635 /DNA_START=49 /DNA_END=522 /DNA_ORIENTATION=- /assembly_acc=CAM_ASM_000762
MKFFLAAVSGALLMSASNAFVMPSVGNTMRSRNLMMSTVTDVSGMGLSHWGLTTDIPICRNLDYDELRQHELDNGEGMISSTGALAVDTGKYTGRSPNDRYVVKQAPSEDDLWWSKVNVPIEPTKFDKLYENSMNHFNTKAKKLYTFEGYCGASEKSR